MRTAVVCVTAAICAAVILICPAASPERVIAALMLVLTLPGTALSDLIDAPSRNDAAVRLLVSAALSISVVVLDSALLYVLGFPLDLTSWSLSLALFTVVASAAAGLRHDTTSVGRSRRPTAAVLRPLLIALPVVLALLAGAAVISARSVRKLARHDRFTQLWILPVSEPGNLATIGVYNHEHRDQAYVLRVYEAGRQVRDENVTVPAGHSFTARQRRLSGTTYIRATLSQARTPNSVYRWVRLTFPSARHRHVGARGRTRVKRR